MTAFLLDLRSAARGLFKRPAFAALVVAVLGIGLACVLFMLALIDGLVVRPLPFPEPDRLLQAGYFGDGGLGDVFPVTSADFVAIRRYVSASADVAGVARSSINLSDLDSPQRVNGGHVSANLFRTLGVAPLLGRDFADADEKPGAAAVAMLSYTTWMNRYGADPAIVGRQIRVDSRPTTVIGVMPEGFSYPRTEAIWVPSALSEGMSPDEFGYWVVLRRHDGVGDAAVKAAFDAWFADAARADPDGFRSRRTQVEPLALMAADRTTRATLGMMFAAVVMVLLVACANAANLLLTRTLARGEELSLRAALGASRRRLIAHLLAESLLLSGIAAVLAIVLARYALAWQYAMMRESEAFPTWLHFGMDARLVALAAVAALSTAVLTGVLPALRAGRLAGGSARIVGGSFARASRVLVIGEVALSCALLICVGTLARGLFAIERSDLGIDTNHLLTARLALPVATYSDSAAQVRLYERLVERLRTEPEVVDATAGTALPGTYFNESHELLADGVASDGSALPQVNSGAVDARFPATYGVRLEDGRFFDARDSADAPAVAVVDRTFVERHGNGQPVIGRRFQLDPSRPTTTTVTVIGVVGAITLDTPGYAPSPSMLLPIAQHPYRIVSVAVRTRGNPADFAPRLQEIMRGIDADAPLYWVREYPAVIGMMTVGERSLAKNFGAFGFIALALSAAGIYGVLAFAVSRRTREIGVRRALGAPMRRVLRDVFARSLMQLGIGLAIGVAVGVPFAHRLSGSLRMIASVDVLVVAAALGVLLLAAALAVIVPARRALRIDPMVALRHE